jgi:hypothetical protein
MNTSKLSPSLSERLEHAGGDESIDLVVELRPLSTEQTDASSRGERIASLRGAFQREAAPVEAAIRAAGGEVLNGIWINRTILARIPTEFVTCMAELDGVFALDLPRPAEPGMS